MNFSCKNEILKTIDSGVNFKRLDERTQHIFDCYEDKIKKSPKSIFLLAEEQRSAIKTQLKISDKKLNELISFGNVLVTNIKVSNEKRELLRRDFEKFRNKVLQFNLNNESVESAAYFNAINTKWTDLQVLKEPMGLFEKLEEQKKRMSDLMKSKDLIIQQCQIEIDRVNEKLYSYQEKQVLDIQSFVGRIENQIELIKNAYKEHMELLENTIEDERKVLTMTASTKGKSVFEASKKTESKKIEMAKEKQKCYAEEVKKSCLEQEEISRAVRIRLERDAEKLELELRNTKNNIFMNSEKLDYNYQVLQKRNKENIVINNQQKHRIAKMYESISALKKKVHYMKTNSNIVLQTLTADVQKLHTNINDMEKKTEQLQTNNGKKFETIWNINFREVSQIMINVFKIDKILYEQQLGNGWSKPKVDYTNINSTELISRTSPTLPTNQFRNSKARCNRNASDVGDMAATTNKFSKNRLLNKILRKITDRAGFLVETKLLNILEPFTDEEKCLVRIDSIFKALRITNTQDVTSLTEYFTPYYWCPNCIQKRQPEIIKNLLNFEDHDFKSEKIERLSNIAANLHSKHKDKMQKIEDGRSSQICSNHYFVIEPTFVLEALKEFVENQFFKSKYGGDIGKMFSSRDPTKGKVLSSNPDPNDVTTVKEKVKEFWSKFSSVMPIEKQKLWNSLEHGLNHFLAILKKRDLLDKECEFLRRQNIELRHLLKKYLPR